MPPLTPRLLPGVKKCLNRVEKETRVQLMNGANLERKFTKGFNTRQGVSATVNIRVKGSNFASVFSGTNDAHIIKVSFIL